MEWRDQLYLFQNERPKKSGQGSAEPPSLDQTLIIGDNRQVLRDLLAEYQGKIKMVYLDPPYNTCSAKSYQDSESAEKWQENIITVLEAIHKLLREDGVVLISIDDNRYAELKLACDRIFSSVNFGGTFITRQAQRSNSRLINITHEYVLCYARNRRKADAFHVKRMDIPEQREMILRMTESVGQEKDLEAAERKLWELIDYYCEKYAITWLKNYNRVDEKGEIYFASDLSMPGVPARLDMEDINLHLEPLKTRSWASPQKFRELAQKNLLIFRNGRPYQKKYLKEARDNAPSILNFYSRFGTRDMNELGLRDLFDTPKPVELIKFLIRIAHVKSGDIILDCYTGSGTTAQAALEVNREDERKIRYILIQRREKIAGKGKIATACARFGIPPEISEITRLRINRVYEKLNIPNKLKVIENGEFSQLSALPFAAGN